MRKRKEKMRANIPLAIFASIVVVGGVVMVAYVASQTSTLPTPPSNTPVTQQVASSSSAFLVVSRDGSRVVSHGTSSPFHFPDDVKKLGTPISLLQGVRVSSGEHVVLDSEAHVIAASTALHSPDGRRSLASAPFRSDGVGAITVRYGSESQDLVIRLPNGTPIRSVIPAGWWDERTAAVTGIVTSTRAIFAVSLSGTVQQIAFLPDEFDHLALMHGSAWFTTETPGPGLEAQPMSPSTLERIGRDGTRATVVTEEVGLISTYTMNASGTVVYTFTPDDRSPVKAMMIFKGEKRMLMDGVPLQILNDGSVVVHHDTYVIIAHLSGSEEAVRELEGLPADAAVFPLDENQRNP